MQNDYRENAKTNINKLLETLDARENQTTELLDITDVLRQAYQTVDSAKNPEALINRLVNYIRSVAFKGKIYFPPEDEKLMLNLAEIGKKAGINGLYMANFSDKSQFFSSFGSNRMVYRG